MQILIAVLLVILALVLFVFKKWLPNEALERAANVSGIIATAAGIVVLAFYTASLGSRAEPTPLATVDIPTATSLLEIPSETPPATASPVLPSATWTPSATLTATEAPPSATPTATPIEINVSRSSTNYDGKVILTVERIEVRLNNRMRWYISFWNTDNRAASMAFGESESYVADEYGMLYEILAMEPSNFIGAGVRAQVKSQGWLEFEIPTSDARNFQLFLVRWSFGSHQLRYDGPLEVSLPVPLHP
jgi:hypothetical protein